jgi:hypothetical protein
MAHEGLQIVCYPADSSKPPVIEHVEVINDPIGAAKVTIAKALELSHDENTEYRDIWVMTDSNWQLARFTPLIWLAVPSGRT